MLTEQDLPLRGIIACIEENLAGTCFEQGLRATLRNLTS